MGNLKKKPFLVAPPWMIFFFFISHTAMWFVSFGQTIWIVREVRKEIRVLYNKLK
jgi:hypothetical protein